MNCWIDSLILMLTKDLTVPDSVSLLFLGNKDQCDFSGEDGI